MFTERTLVGMTFAARVPRAGLDQALSQPREVGGNVSLCLTGEEQRCQQVRDLSGCTELGGEQPDYIWGPLA